MKKVTKLCIISGGYPSENNPVYTFVDQLVSEFADNKVECLVIAPLSISKLLMKKDSNAPRVSFKKTKNGNFIKILRPRYMSFSNKLLNINSAKLTYKSFKSSVELELKKHDFSPDAIYGHFIAMSGMAAADLGDYFNIPSFLAYGESSPNNFLIFNKDFLKDKLKKLSGIISVSTENKNELLSLDLIEDPDKIGVFPNAIDEKKFFNIEKKIAREKLGISPNIFIVAFVGSFIERKGVDVLNNVLDKFDGVYSFFIGKGELEPTCKNILYKGTVSNEKIHLYLNAADVFVLPTSAEGCSNAIIEALACGLPIISSDQPFNDDILNENNSIRLNVRNENAVYEAIELLSKKKELKNKMSIGALKSAFDLKISKRATNIMEFMESKIQ